LEPLHSVVGEATYEMATGTGSATTTSTTTTSAEGGTTEDDRTFDPRIFWAMNVCLLVAIVATCLYCKYGFLSQEERRLRTDLEYQRNVMAREERKRKANYLSPEKRKKLLLASFQKHQVIMVCTLRY
jgi:hypothetical protein